MTAFPGLRIGHAADPALKSGVTVFLPDAPAIAAAHISGGAPASRESDLLRLGNLVERIDAVVLSGGSAFGLAAADGVMDWLASRGRGYAVGRHSVPIVPAAALFDLANGGETPAAGTASSVYAALGRAACDTASSAPPTIGSAGAGVGATTADLKGGFGAALSVLPDCSRIAAYVAVNPVGRVTIGTSPHFRAGAFEEGVEFGGLGLPAPLPPDATAVVLKPGAQARGATTLAVLATDGDLTRAEAHRLAIAAHDGIALAVFPAHTLFDGDAVFVLATATRQVARPGGLVALSAAAVATLARAISVAVYAAEPAPGDLLPTWRERYGIEAAPHAG